jgi:glu-tRNAGln amidotransferase C subunit
MKEGNGMDKESLVVLANKLMFTMDESEYDTLLEEFDIILKQMDLIGKIPDIEHVEPLIYPIEKTFASLREDIVLEELPLEDILLNSGSTLYNQVKLPKVVE